MMLKACRASDATPIRQTPLAKPLLRSDPKQPGRSVLHDVNCPIEVSIATGLTVRTWCAGRFSPYGPTDVGAVLYGWAEDVGWTALSDLAGNDVPTPADPTSTMDPDASQIQWSSSDIDQAHRFLVERDWELTFQCRPAGVSGGAGRDASVAMDYAEVRAQYTIQ